MKTRKTHPMGTEECPGLDSTGTTGTMDTTEGVESLWVEMTEGRDGSYREVWRSLTEALRGSAGSVPLLRSVQAALESQGREIVRAAYWRGYHAGYREGSGDMLPLFGQAQKPRDKDRFGGGRQEPNDRERPAREKGDRDA